MMLHPYLQLFFTPLIVAVVFMSPIVLVLVVLMRKKRTYRAAAEEPFTRLPLRPPGESLRLRIDELSTDFDGHFLTMGITAVISVAVTVVAPAETRAMVVLIALFGIGLVTISCGRRLLKVAEELWTHRMGFTGERVVGEELNQLLASGFKVFHDVPFDGFNVDHVLVGSPGVFAVETKAVSKPARVRGLSKATVYSDGATLRFPHREETRFIPQARRNASDLSKWLSSATGEPVPVSAILTLPGWAIERRAASDVNVLRPDEIKRSFPGRPAKPLSPEQIQRIAHQLTERCRLAKEPLPT